MNNILVIAPHPDDEILGCGGTIAKYSKMGKDVFVLILTNASIGAPELFSKEDILSVRKEAQSAHHSLGVKKTIFADFPAPALNAFPEFKMSNKISGVLDDIKPDTVLIPHPGDMHQDHKAVYRSALVALRPQGTHKVEKVLCYETLSETNWAPMHEKAFVPNYFVDVSKELKNKIEGMKCFKSQLKAFPHSRSVDALEALAKYRGVTIGVKSAEAFFVERILNL